MCPDLSCRRVSRVEEALRQEPVLRGETEQAASRLEEPPYTGY